MCIRTKPSPGSRIPKVKLYMATISALQHNPDIKIQRQRLTV